jgi:hypothetical protein
MREVPSNELQGIPQLQDVPKEESWKPSVTQTLKEYEIRITFLDRGCIVHVGCKSIAFEDVSLAMEQLSKYVNNPYEEQQEWRKLLN